MPSPVPLYVTTDSLRISFSRNNVAVAPCRAHTVLIECQWGFELSGAAPPADSTPLGVGWTFQRPPRQHALLASVPPPALRGLRTTHRGAFAACRYTLPAAAATPFSRPIQLTGWLPPRPALSAMRQHSLPRHCRRHVGYRRKTGPRFGSSAPHRSALTPHPHVRVSEMDSK